MKKESRKLIFLEYSQWGRRSIVLGSSFFVNAKSSRVSKCQSVQCHNHSGLFATYTRNQTVWESSPSSFRSASTIRACVCFFAHL